MYVDGWNFYYSLKGAGIREYGWCNFPMLAKQQTSEKDAEVKVKYFTSVDKPNKEKIDRQTSIWWTALDFMKCDIIKGEFRDTIEEIEDHNRLVSQKWREKQTDVALASHMVKDCSQIDPGQQPGTFLWSPGFDRAILLTRDTDFIPAVRIASREPFNRKVLVLLPPSGSAFQESADHAWKQEGSTKVSIKPLQLADLARALLPKVVEGPAGKNVECYRSWMWREKYESDIAWRRKPPAKNPRR
jgi:uncharacterized LabA/DUF88 family protein